MFDRHESCTAFLNKAVWSEIGVADESSGHDGVRGTERRMSRERQFTCGREDTDAMRCTRNGGRQYERGFRKIGPARNALHRCRIEFLRVEQDGNWITEQRAVRKNVHDTIAAVHSDPLEFRSFSQQRSLPMFVSRFARVALAVACTLSLAGCIIAVDRKAETPKANAEARVVRQVRIETHVKDDAVPTGCPEGSSTVTNEDSTVDGKHVRMIMCTKRVGTGETQTGAALLPKLAEVRLLLSKDPALQGDARTRVLAALDEQIARVAVLKSSP